jgi:hypothetical protein
MGTIEELQIELHQDQIEKHSQEAHLETIQEIEIVQEQG